MSQKELVSLDLALIQNVPPPLLIYLSSTSPFMLSIVNVPSTELCTNALFVSIFIPLQIDILSKSTCNVVDFRQN